MAVTNTTLKLQPHQERAVREAELRDGLIVEYGTGTGKTGIMAALAHATLGPTLVLVKNSLIEQITEEFREWFPSLDFRVLDSGYSIQQRVQTIELGAYTGPTILSHEALSYKGIRNALASIEWEAILVDELTRFRNWSARTRTLLKLRAKKRVGFTGNLIVKSPADVWFPCRFIKPGLFGINRKETFNQEYCLLGGYTGMEPIDVRPDKEAQLNRYLDTIRIKTDLSDIRDMPPRTTTVRRVDLLPRQRTLYHELRDTLRLEIERTDDRTFELQVNTYVARMQRLQEIAAGFARNTEGDVTYLPSGKTMEMLELLQDEPMPTIVWCWWIPEQAQVASALLAAELPYTHFDGRQSFIDGRVDTLVLSLAQGAHGLNLDRAKRMIYHSLPWDLEILLQSQERNYRLTTTEPKDIVHLVARGTIDEYVRNKVLDKRRVAQKFSRSSALAALGG